MKLLALDPSSSCTGYAVLVGLEPAGLIDAGQCRPSLSKTALGELPAWRRAHLWQDELTHVRKIRSICRDVADLIKEHQPGSIVVEIASGKFGSGAKHGARGSLTTYGMAAWAVLAECERQLPAVAPGADVVPGVAEVTERQWIGGRGPGRIPSGKDQRQALVQQLYPGRYDPALDTGADVADAIMLSRWWWGRVAGG